MFRQSLFVNIPDWYVARALSRPDASNLSESTRLCARHSFLSFYLTNALSGLLTFFLPMTQEAHNAMLLTKDPDNSFCAVMADVFESDLLHHRGKLCFSAYLKKRASQMAALQYMSFILILNYTHNNVLVFPTFSKDANFDLQQQAVFVAIAWSMDMAMYEVTNVLCKRLFDLTPLYIGEAVVTEHNGLNFSLMVIAAHIISDVYLSMVLGMEGGLYFANAWEEDLPEEVFLPGDASAAGGLLGGS